MCWCKHRMTSTAEQDALRTQIIHKCHLIHFFKGEDNWRGHYVAPLSCPVQVGSSVKVKWQNCKFCLTAEAPLRETKWRQPVVVTHCCWQGDDEHLSLKGRSWAFPMRNHVPDLMSKGKNRGWNRKPWGPKLHMILYAKNSCMSPGCTLKNS